MDELADLLTQIRSCTQCAAHFAHPPRPIVQASAPAKLLIENGFTAVADIREGMLGSGGGPGWIRRGLPVTGKPAK